MSIMTGITDNSNLNENTTKEQVGNKHKMKKGMLNGMWNYMRGNPNQIGQIPDSSSIEP